MSPSIANENNRGQVLRSAGRHGSSYPRDSELGRSGQYPAIGGRCSSYESCLVLTYGRSAFKSASVQI